jgi:pantoate--beta-alanine ligase
MQTILRQIPSGEIEYVSIVDAETLESIEIISGRVLAAVAVRIGTTRLIDNIVIDISRKLI